MPKLARHVGRRLFILLLALPWLPENGAAAICVGDCDTDGNVTVEEIVSGVDIALGDPASVCADFDANIDRSVTVEELLQGVTNALEGCPAAPPAAPALGTSDLASGPLLRTAWIKLEFVEPIAPEALAGFELKCAGWRHAVHMYRLSPTTAVANPSPELPPEAECNLAWTGPAGTVQLGFTTMPAGETAIIHYDRDDRRRTNPFPDDFYLTEDSSKPNGVRLAVPAPTGTTDVQAIFRVLLRETVKLDGFSPIAHATIEFTDPPSPASLPTSPAASLDPLATIGLFDITENSPTFGDRIPFRAQVRDDLNVQSVRTHSALLFPSIPLEPGGRYALVVTRRAYAGLDRPFDPSPFMRAALAEPVAGESEATAEVRALVDEVLAALATDPAQPIERDDVALAVRITVRTTDDIPRDLLAIKEDLVGAPPPAFTITAVEPGTAPQLAAVVRGTWEAPDWRENKFFKHDPVSGRPVQTRTNTVPFILALPAASLDGPVPITMYQHGNPGSAEREVPSDARDYLAAAGFAVIGFTDNLNREVSAGMTDPTAAITAQITDIFFTLLQNQRVPDYWVETNAEQLAFLRMIESLGSLDVLPIGDPDGVPELDPTRPLTYVGISQGANYAPGFIPYAPELRAAAFMVGGARLSEVLIHQQPQAFLQQLGGLYPNMTAADIWMALSLFQTIYDNQDEHNHGRFLYRAPVAVNGTTRKASVLVVEGLNDSLVPNHATESLAWQIGPIPHLLPVQRGVPFLETVTGPVVANIDAETTAAFYQYVPVGVDGIAPTPGCTVLSPTSQVEGHYCAQSAAESEHQRVVFFQTALTDAAPTIIDPLDGSQ
jgi:hypothetical protein